MTDVDDEPKVFKEGEPFRQYPYVIVSFLGSGAAGQVYLVRHRFTG